MTAFIYSQIDSWPALAWLAFRPAGSRQVHIFHGSRVETRSDWFCEAVWDAEFAAGDFDRTDLVFGSGGRIRDDGVVFVSAATTLDRLHSFEDPTGIRVSNSLPCLLAVLRADLDPAYPHYIRDLRSVIRGIDRYERHLTTSAGLIRLTYYDNLHVGRLRRSEIPKPFRRRDFTSFARYRGFLSSALGRIVANMSSADRRHPYSLMGTISSGYDSPAVTVLGREHGLREVIGWDKHWRGDSDSGAPIAALLGVTRIPIPADAWRQNPLAPVPFLAADANGGDVVYAGARPFLTGRLLLTGYQSGRAWKKRSTGPNDHNIARKDQSGLSLSEFRLRAGFLHCPVAFMGIRQVADINALGRSPEMAPWDVGGDYNKPIARRIVEEAGAPRGSFATRNVGVSVQLSSPDVFRSARFRDPYLEWLRPRSAIWLRSGRLPPQVVSALARPLRSPAGWLADAVRTVEKRIDRQARLGRPLKKFATRDYAYKFLFPWAVQQARTAYEAPDPDLEVLAAHGKALCSGYERSPMMRRASGSIIEAPATAANPPKNSSRNGTDG